MLGVVAATAVSGPGAVPAGATDPPPGATAATPPPPGASPGTWVTLLTGDRVLVGTGRAGNRQSGRGDVLAVRPGEGRERVAFHRYVDRGDSYVVPADAQSLLGRGRLDRRVFDVTALARYGYDDRRRPDLPLIVTGGSAAAASAAAQVRVAPAGGRVVRQLPSVAGAAVRADKDGAGAFWASVKGGSGAPTRAVDSLATGLSKIWLDGPVRASLDTSVPQVGAPAAWRAGHTGRGARVAVLDTGIDATHPDLADAVSESRDFTGSETGTADLVGHGTHVASIITGSGAASGGRFAGVAPDATLLVGKVLDDRGSGSDSQVIAGMEWAAAEDAAVANLSLSGFFASDGTDVLDLAVNRLTAESGTLFVVAAGNSGPDAETVSSPGAADAALTVGAVDRTDALAEFSSRGPRWTRPAIKPDLTAPGVGIVAARGTGTALGEPVDEAYTRSSGTSMATPHVAGAAAVLAAEHPDWAAEQLEAALVGAAAPTAGLSVYQQGAGRLDLGRADAQQVYATPATVDDGVARWPHADDTPVTTTLTYHNPTGTPLDLDLVLDVRDPAGAPAPAGMFRLSVGSVTVPARGGAAVTVTADTAVAGPDGLYGGVLTATGDGGRVRVRTPVGITREVESYDLTLHFRDHDGAATDEYSARFVSIAEQKAYLPYDASGTVVVRLPKGTYFLEAIVATRIGVDDANDFRVNYAIEPAFAVTGPASHTVDARNGKPVGVELDRPEARPANAIVFFVRTTEWGDTGFFSYRSDFDDLDVTPSTTVAPAGDFDFGVEAAMARPDGAGGFDGSPYLYHLAWSEPGRVPADPVRYLPDRAFAVAHSSHARAGARTDGVRDDNVGVPLPGTVTEFYTPGLTWSGSFAEADRAGDGPGGPTFQLNTGRTYTLGKRYAERWNTGPFGPGLPDSSSPIAYLSRAGDRLDVNVPMFSDQVETHFGYSETDSATTTLHRDGEQVGDPSPAAGSGQFMLPPEPATYRLATVATRSVSALSTRVEAAWTFRSEHVADIGAGAVLPIMALRFAPDLDDRNRAPAGRRFALPVYVQRQAGASYGRLTSMTVDVSFDDGTTWRRAAVTGSGDRRTATVDHPRHGGFASLRARATDAAGNAVEQTIIRAYALRG